MLLNLLAKSKSPKEAIKRKKIEQLRGEKKRSLQSRLGDLNSASNAPCGSLSTELPVLANRRGEEMGVEFKETATAREEKFSTGERIPESAAAAKR